MSKADRILEAFPAFYRATESHKLLAYLVGRLAAPLDHMDGELFRIQRSRRLLVAEHATDIVHLAGLLNLTGFHFDDILADRATTYEEKLALMRQRVQGIARIHLDGLGTPLAVMQAAALFLNGRVVPEVAGGPLAKHVDPDGYSHRVLVAFDHLPGQPREMLYLHENPYRRRTISPAPRWPTAVWSTHNESVARAPARFVVQGVGDRTVLPRLYCPKSGHGFFFNGVVPDGEVLVVDADDGATLGDRPVDPWLVFFEGGVYDYARVGRDEPARLDRPVEPPLLAGARITEAAGLHADVPKATSPAVPPGRSEWHLSVAEGRYNGARFDSAVFAVPASPIGMYDGDRGFDHCVFHYPPSAVAGMAWDERTSCAFKLMLPSYLPRPDGEEDRDEAAAAGVRGAVARIGEVMPRFKPAGIRAYVDHAQDGWVLGQSVMRAPDASAGEGVAYHSTRLINPRDEMLISDAI